MTIARIIVAGVCLALILALSSCEDKNPGPLASTFFGEGVDDPYSPVVGVKIIFSSIVLIGDSNKDGVANPGENIYYQVYLRNLGTHESGSIPVTMATTSPWVQNLVPSIPNYFDISAGYEILVWI